MNLTIFIHCKKCMIKTHMKKSLMKLIYTDFFDEDKTYTYQCPNCKNQIELTVNVTDVYVKGMENDNAEDN